MYLGSVFRRESVYIFQMIDSLTDLVQVLSLDVKKKKRSLVCLDVCVLWHWHSSSGGKGHALHV